MFKIITFILIIYSSIYAVELKNNYTLILSNVKNLENAQTFISRYLKNNTKEVFIIKYKTRYLVTYGAFNNRSEVHTFKKQLPLKLLELHPYLLQRDFNLLEDKEKVQVKIMPKMEKQTNSEIIKKEIVKITLKENNEIYKKTLDIQQQPIKKNLEVKEKILNVEQQVNNEETKDSNFKIKIDMTYSPIEVKSNFSYGASNKINLQSDLGLNKMNHTLIPEIGLSYKNHDIFTSYFSLNQSKSQTISKDFTFKSYTYNNGEILNTNYNTSWLTVGYRYNYKNAKIGFDIHNYNNKINIVGASNETDIKKDFTFTTLALDVNHDINKFNFTYGGSYGKKSNELRFYNYYLGVGMKDTLLPNSNLSFGYKSQTLDIKNNSYEGKSKYSGGYIKFEKIF